mmetsp:Transcript_18238/g.54225  ORF Transcript_18238/g.54225 Transcript_18238/m.54225 type:complete len:260 (-) Transcript_18238:24-803(-)
MTARRCLVLMATARAMQPSATARRFLLARHGETNFNAEGRIQGTLDASHLTAHGVQQAAGLGAYIARTERARIQRVWCSPMRRARETLAEIEKACADAPLPEATVRHDLREIELHHWEGRLKTEIAAAEAEGWALWRRDPPAYVTPSGAKPLPDLWDRAVGNWAALREDPADGAVLVVSHGALGRCMVAAALGGGVDTFRTPKFAFDNCNLVEVAWEPDAPAASHWRRLYTEKTPWESSRQAVGAVSGGTWEHAAAQAF